MIDAPALQTLAYLERLGGAHYNYYRVEEISSGSIAG